MTTPSIPTLTSVLLTGLSGPSGGDSKRRTSLTPSACPNSPVRNKSRSISYTRMDLSVLETPTSILGLCAGISAATVSALMITASVDSRSVDRNAWTSRPVEISKVWTQRSIVETTRASESSGENAMDTGDVFNVITLDMR